MFKITSKNNLFTSFLAILISMFFYAPASFAQNKCSALFLKVNKLADMTRTKEIDLTKMPEYEQMLREYPNLKSVPQYEQTGLLVLHASSFTLDGYKYYLSLLEHLPPDVRTLITGSKDDYTSLVSYQFLHHVRKNENGQDLDRFLTVQNEDTPVGTQTPQPRWVQDHMGPLVTYTGWDGVPVTGMVTASYRYGYKFSGQLTSFLGIQVIKNVSGNHEWGNFTVINDTAYMIRDTDQIVEGSKTHSDLKIRDFMYTGVRKIVMLPQPVIQGNKQGIPHSDEFLIPLSKDSLATNIPEYADFFKKQGKKVALLPNNGDLVLGGLPLSHLTYTNAVLVSGANKKVLFVPQFGSLTTKDKLFGANLEPNMVKTIQQRDRTALAAYRKIAKDLNITVIPVDVSQFTFYNFGGMHCATGICGIMPTAEKTPAWFNKGDGPL